MINKYTSMVLRNQRIARIIAKRKKLKIKIKKKKNLKINIWLYSTVVVIRQNLELTVLFIRPSWNDAIFCNETLEVFYIIHTLSVIQLCICMSGFLGSAFMTFMYILI